MPSVLIIGATRGLGLCLAKDYASRKDTIVYGTSRSTSVPKEKDIQWITNIDLTSPTVGDSLVNQLGSKGVGGGGGGTAGAIKPFDIVMFTAGYFVTEDFEEGLNWKEELTMYTTSAIAPPFIVRSLYKAKLLTSGSRVVIVSSESGSITLRHETEGGGNYGHHASKAASNMVGKLLSLDLKDAGIIVSVVHPGFMRTEMTKGVGFDKYWDDGGAVLPEEAALSLIEWTDKLDMSKSGEYWAPRGPRDIGTAEPVLGKDLSTPLKLPF